MIELLTYLFGSLCIVEGIYIWMLRDNQEQREGYIKRIESESRTLHTTNQTLRAKARIKQ